MMQSIIKVIPRPDGIEIEENIYGIIRHSIFVQKENLPEVIEQLTKANEEMK